MRERQVSKNLNGQGNDVYPEDYPSPAGARLLEKFATRDIMIVCNEKGTNRRLAQLSDKQQGILNLLDLPGKSIENLQTEVRSASK